MILTPIPDLTAVTGAPRITAIEYPLGRTFGQPGDIEMQTQILRAMLSGVTSMYTPGSTCHLPYDWPEAPKEVNADPKDAPPIAGYIVRHLWELPRLLNRDIPKGEVV